MRIVFKNFRSLRNTELTLSPLTVIVGPNASGKTSILKALDPSMNLFPADVWQRRRDLPGRIERRLDGGFIASFLRNGQSGIESDSPRTYSYQYLRLELDDLRSENRLQEERRLSEKGRNLTNVFSTLPRKTQADLAAEFCRLVPVFSDVDSTPSSDGNHRLRFQDRWNSNIWYEPGQVSDGSILVLAFLILQHQQPPVTVLAVEEPEHSLHHYLVGEVITVLRRMTLGEIGPSKMSVVVTTHSPEALQFVAPEEARFLNRERDGAVSITAPSTDTNDWRIAFVEYGKNLGSLWLSGGVGGVPSGG